MALGIQSGDEVIVPSVTFAASANAVLMLGATPVFAEVNPRDFQIYVKECERLVTSRTTAIMPVHLYGVTADMKSVDSFAVRHGLKVIEDAAQALGVTNAGYYAGTWGDVGCFSFFADKTITTGEGGYVVCRDQEIYESLLLLRNQGRKNRGSFIHDAIGYNFRITDVQAAIGLAQLDKLPEIVKRKLAILSWYHEQLDDVDEVEFIGVPSWSSHVPFRVVLMCKKAHPLMGWLREHGVEPRTTFYPLHLQPCYANATRYLPNAEFCWNNGVCLPVYPTLKREQVIYVCDTIKQFYST
jgi:perosamine synthetase